MITLRLNEQEAAVLKQLMVQLMANQVNANPQGIINNAQNCIHFMKMLENEEKAQPAIMEAVKKEESL